MKIEIDVYSGRPNPTFTVSASEASELAKLLTNLSRLELKAPELGLGYRGFVIYDATGLAGLAPPIRIYQRYVITGPAEIVYRDDKSCEQWLKQKARQAGFGSLIA